MGWFDGIFGDSDDAAADEPRERRNPFGRIPAEPKFDAFRAAWKAGAALSDLFGSNPVKIKQPVGTAAPNRRPDVAKVETFLGRPGHLDLAKTEGPTGYYGSRVDQGIRGFQKDNGLNVDGLINPGGPTLQRIGAALFDTAAAAVTPKTGLRTPDFVPQAGRATGGAQAASEAASSSPSPLLDRIAGWLDGRRAATGGTKASAIDRAPPDTATANAVGKETAQSNPPAAAQASDDHTGAWFESGLIPDSTTSDDPIPAENYMRGKIEEWRGKGYNDAADNLQRYLDGKGGVVPLSREDIAKFDYVRQGEEKNKNHFINQTFLARDTNEPTVEDLRSMKDGDQIQFKDYWESAFDNNDVAYNYLRGDANFALAYGANNLRADGDFTAKRHGERITIEGTVRQTWKEPYNFERWQPGAAQGHTLERYGKAKPYVSIAAWERPVRAVVLLRNGDLHEVESLEWGKIYDLSNRNYKR